MNYLLFEICFILPLSVWIEFTAASLLNNETANFVRESPYSPSPYNLEQFCKEEGSVYFTIDPWKAAIFRIGFLLDDDGLLATKKIHKCTINVQTNKDFWLVATVEHMKIRGFQDSSNKWICSDYLKFLSPGQHILKKIISILYSNIDEQSEKLCGTKQLDGSVLKHVKILEGQSTDMNSFITFSNKLQMEFHQEKELRGLFNNSFVVVVTTFRHASDKVECEGKQKCYGNDVFCISPNLVCDGHVNCAFPGSGTDERVCQVNEKPAIFNMTSMVIIVLVSLVAVGMIICFVATIACRMKRRLENSARRRSSSPANFNMPVNEPSAPRIERESTLPRYETVILSDVEQNIGKGDLLIEELPPQYDSLFPHGPSPKDRAQPEDIKDS